MNDLFSPANSMYRTVHAIGQGAFHSEIFHSGNHCVFCCVYDCGTSSPAPDMGKRLGRCLKCIPISNKQDHFPENPKHPIDILFLSHLDADHVNRVSDLKNTHAISRVVLPLLDDECKVATFLSGVVAGLHGMDLNDFKSLVFQPKMFFGGSTPILRVKPIPLDPQEGWSDNLDSIDIEDLTESKNIPSFLPLKSSQLPRWRFIPFCFDEKERQKLFLDKLRQCPMLKEDIKDKICKNAPTELDWVSEPENLRILRCVYKSLPDGINGNSLLLYSGPKHAQQNISIERCFPNQPHPCEQTQQRECPYLGGLNPTTSGDNSAPLPSDNQAGCLYLGDMNLNAGGSKKAKVIKYITDRLDLTLKNLDLIQIPHHGSEISFHDKLLKLNTSVKYYFLSYGIKKEKKKQKHPSPNVIQKLGDKAIEVTNESSSFCTRYTFPDANKKESSQK